jgi:hypothetical protein
LDKARGRSTGPALGLGRGKYNCSYPRDLKQRKKIINIIEFLKGVQDMKKL